MDAEAIKKRYLTAVIAAAGIITAIVIYTVAVEALCRGGYKPPLTPPASYLATYAFYIAATAALMAVRLATRVMDEKKPTLEGTVKLLTKLAIIRAAICEVPAVCGLILFILTGDRRSFYLLIVFAAALEVYYFPRLAAWKERLRGEFGQLPNNP